MTRQTKLLIKTLLCIGIAAFSLYAHIDTINDLTALRLAIPILEKEVRALQKENEHLHYEIDRFESPIHLMELSRKSEYGHLKHPLVEDVIILKKEKR